MRKRLPITFAVALVLAAPAAAALAAAQHGGDSHGLQERIAQARAREGQLSAQIDDFTSQIRSLEARAVDVSARLATLESDLSLHRRRLAAVRTLLELQTRQLLLMREQYAAALDRLNARLVAVYKADEPTTVDVLLAARSFDDVLDSLDYLNEVAAQDKQIAVQFGQAKARVRRSRARTANVHTRIAAQTQVIAYRTQQQADLRARLLTSSRRLASSRAGKQKELASTKQQEQEWVAEANALASASAQVSAEIQGSSGSSETPPSSSGLAWPLSGPITSPYGMRWGSLHPGIDIAVPTGTPIRAAASGTVLVAAYSGGYGYLVVIDHGNGMATAYAHQSRLASSPGQRVAQGEVIGYAGSTGFSTGPHLHFEVRVNGSPVDPLGYL